MLTVTSVLLFGVAPDDGELCVDDVIVLCCDVGDPCGFVGDVADVGAPAPTSVSVLVVVLILLVTAPVPVPGAKHITL